MCSIIRHGRVRGALEIIYHGVVTRAVRMAAIGKSQAMMGTVPVAIVDFSVASFAMTPDERREFQSALATSDGFDQTVVIYVAGPHRDALECEAEIGNSLGRIVEVVDDIEDAYAFLAAIEADE